MSRLALVGLALLAAASPQESPVRGTVIERTVRAVHRDPLDRARETGREERVHIRPDRLCIEDLTFGTRLIIRHDRGLVWIVDAVSGTYSELTFEAVAARRKEKLDEIEAARDRVKGSADEGPLTDLLKGLGRWPKAPVAEVKDTGERAEVAGRACEGRALILDGDIHYFEVLVDPSLRGAMAAFEQLAAIGAYPPEIATGIAKLGGFPLRGTVRAALFLDRVTLTLDTTAVRVEEVPDDVFLLPGGLRKTVLKGFEADPAPDPPKPTYEPAEPPR